MKAHHEHLESSHISPQNLAGKLVLGQILIRIKYKEKSTAAARVPKSFILREETASKILIVLQIYSGWQT